MAVYEDQYTAMVIFAQSTTQFGVQNPNTINPNGLEPYNSPNSNTPEIPSEKEQGGFTLKDAKKLAISLGVVSAAKNVMNYYKNNYGDIMQDSNKQVEINEAMNIINMGISIGAGFAVGGVVGGIAAIGANVVNVGLQTASFQRTLHRNNVQSEIMMARTQYASINGGR